MSVCIERYPSVPALRTPRLGAASPAAMLVVVALAALALAIALSAALRPAPLDVTIADLPGTSRVAVADAAVIERGHGYVSVVGQVRNETGKRLRGAGVVLELLDASGRVRAVETALVEADAVAPGAMAPFRVLAQEDDTVTSCRVRFRQVVAQ